MKTAMLAVLCLMFGISPAVASEAEISGFIGWESGYMFFPGYLLYEDPVVEVSAQVKWENGFGASIFHATGVDGSCFENESCGSQIIAPSIFYEKPIFSDFLIRGQLSYFSLYSLQETAGDLFEAKLRLEYRGDALGGVHPYVETNYWELLEVGGGIGLTRLGASWKKPITKRLIVDLALDARYDSAPFEENGWTGYGEIGLWKPLSKHFHAGVWVKHSHEFDKFELSDRNNTVWGLGISGSF